MCLFYSYSTLVSTSSFFLTFTLFVFHLITTKCFQSDSIYFIFRKEIIKKKKKEERNWKLKKETLERKYGSHKKEEEEERESVTVWTSLIFLSL